MSYLNVLPVDLKNLLDLFRYPKITIVDSEYMDSFVYVYELLIETRTNNAMIYIYIESEEMEKFFEFFENVYGIQNDLSTNKIDKNYNIFTYSSDNKGTLKIRSYSQHYKCDEIHLCLTGNTILSFCSKIIQLFEQRHMIPIGSTT